MGPLRIRQRSIRRFGPVDDGSNQDYHEEHGGDDHPAHLQIYNKFCLKYYYVHYLEIQPGIKAQH